MPGWFRKMESFLPMRNRTITFSYLLARKTARPPGDQPMLRVLGDTLKQKGKTLQMICRGGEREFLSWLSRDGEAPILPSGELIPVPPHNLRGSELRVIKD
jgi:hypothetical protein